jgi:RIO-like serine/threonine protein kinase
MSYSLNNIVLQRENKTLYIDGDKIIKLYVKNHTKSYVLNEAINHARVEENTNLNIPKLLEVPKINDQWALVIENVEGKTLAQLMQENPDKLDLYLNMFVDIQLEVLSQSVTLLNRIKDKFRRKIANLTTIDESTRFELLQKLEGMKNHAKLCHGDFNPSNIIIKNDGSHYILDWAHATQGNASADVARTYLIFKMENKDDLAEQYLKLFAQKSGIEVKHIQRWIPLVAAEQLEKGKPEEQEFLLKCVNVAEYQ